MDLQVIDAGPPLIELRFGKLLAHRRQLRLEVADLLFEPLIVRGR